MKIKVLCIAIILHLWSNEILADDFNYSFIRGGSKEVPEVLKNTGGNIPGTYVVDLLINGSKTASSVELVISNDDADHICLSDEWLQGKGITINKEFYKTYLNPARNCYLIDKEKNSRVFFDPSLQELSIDMPQAGFIDTQKEGGSWDYGSTGFKLAYDLNTSKSSNQDRTTYGNIEGQVNIGEWVLLGRGYAYQGALLNK